MVNYIEKLFCVEILEKISRIKRFLLSEPNVSQQKSIEVTGIFLKALDSILNYLTQFITRLSADSKLGEWERVSIMRRLSDIFKSIDELHAQLQFIYGTWVRPETYTFINNVLEFIPTDRSYKKVNVVLSNRYSFEESDFSSYLKYVLRETGVSVDIQSKSPTVFLPKIERDNPLNWAILAHECGHIDHIGIENILKQLGSISAKADTSTRKVLERWAEEIYCDLFATKILGPAYLASFSMFAFVSAGAGGSEMAHATHPADIVRIWVIQEILQKDNLKVAIQESKLNGANDMASFFCNILEERIKSDRNYIKFTLKQPQSPLVLQELVDVICDQIDHVISLNRKLTLKDFTRTDGLSKRLAKGIIIGSYKNPESIKAIKESFSIETADNQKLNDAKEAVQEARTLLWEIINAGWLYKIESIYPEAFDIFFSSNDKTLKEKLSGWGEKLESMDRLLLKSIESSEIQRLMEA